MTLKLDTVADIAGRRATGRHPPIPGRGVVLPPENTPTRQALAAIRFTEEELAELRKVAGLGPDRFG